MHWQPSSVSVFCLPNFVILWMISWFAHQRYLPPAHPMVIAIAYSAYCCGHGSGTNSNNNIIRSISRNPPIVIRLLLNIYINHTTRITWNGIFSDRFSIKNGVKQGGILSPVLFCIYFDGLLCKLSKAGIGRPGRRAARMPARSAQVARPACWPVAIRRARRAFRRRARPGSPCWHSAPRAQAYAGAPMGFHRHSIEFLARSPSSVASQSATIGGDTYEKVPRAPGRRRSRLVALEHRLRHALDAACERERLLAGRDRACGARHGAHAGDAVVVERDRDRRVRAAPRGCARPVRRVRPGTPTCVTQPSASRSTARVTSARAAPRRRRHDCVTSS